MATYDVHAIGIENMLMEMGLSKTQLDTIKAAIKANDPWGSPRSNVPAGCSAGFIDGMYGSSEAIKERAIKASDSILGHGAKASRAIFATTYSPRNDELMLGAGFTKLAEWESIHLGYNMALWGFVHVGKLQVPAERIVEKEVIKEVVKEVPVVKYVAAKRSKLAGAPRGTVGLRAKRTGKLVRKG